jgi:hypothetical protein
VKQEKKEKKKEKRKGKQKREHKKIASAVHHGPWWPVVVPAL